MITNEELYNNIKAACDRAGLKTKELEIEAGISIGSVNKWRRGKNPAWVSLVLIAERLDVSLDYLCGRASDYNAIAAPKYMSDLVEEISQLTQKNIAAVSALVKKLK